MALYFCLANISNIIIEKYLEVLFMKTITYAKVEDIYKAYALLWGTVALYKEMLKAKTDSFTNAMIQLRLDGAESKLSTLNALDNSGKGNIEKDFIESILYKYGN